MIMYRIRRKDTGQFFGGLAYPWSIKHGHERWNDKGLFYQDIDTINAYLKVLSCNWKGQRKKFTFHHWSAVKMARVLNRSSITKLENLEIIVHEISLNGTKTIDAKDFISSQKKEENTK